MMSTVAPVVSHYQKSHALPHFECLDLRNALVPFTIPLISGDVNASSSGLVWPKTGTLQFISISLPKQCIGAIDDTFGIMWSPHQCKWNYITKKKSRYTAFLSSWPKECNNGIGDACTNCSIWTKKSFAPHFNNPDLRNTIVLLMLLCTSCDTDTDASGIMWYQHQWHYLMPMPAAIVSHDQNGHVAPHSNCLWLNECNSAFGNAEGTMWCKC